MKRPNYHDFNASRRHNIDSKMPQHNLSERVGVSLICFSPSEVEVDLPREGKPRFYAPSPKRGGGLFPGGETP